MSSLPLLRDFTPTFAWAVPAFGLTSLWDFIKAHHTKGLAYHGLPHLQTVAGVSTWLALNEGNVDPRLACIAGMLHDFGHRGSPKDKINVEASLSNLRVVSKIRTGSWEASATFVLPISSRELEEVYSAIACTEYAAPARAFPSPPQTPLARVLRDADIWHPHLAPALSLAHLIALQKELRREYSPFDDLLEEAATFYDNLTWHTQVGQGLEHEVRSRIFGLAFSDDAVLPSVI